MGCIVVSARDFNDWRAYSASLLSKSRDSDELPRSTIDILLKRCREAVATIARWTPGEQEQQDMSNELWNIFTEAVQLAKFLRVQRAQWSIRFPFANSLTQHGAQTGGLLGKCFQFDLEYLTDLEKGKSLMNRKGH